MCSEEYKAVMNDIVGSLSAQNRDQQERIEELERQVADWAPFINQCRMTLAQLAKNPMVGAMIPPASRDMLTRFAAPEGV
jgi:hypothetical protein